VRLSKLPVTLISNFTLPASTRIPSLASRPFTFTLEIRGPPPEFEDVHLGALHRGVGFAPELAETVASATRTEHVYSPDGKP